MRKNLYNRPLPLYYHSYPHILLTPLYPVPQERERERERERDRQTETDRDRQRQTDQTKPRNKLTKRTERQIQKIDKKTDRQRDRENPKTECSH